ncbi:MAG: hypothetical protein WC326_09390 [Candidatus Delongbacteria bacterium]
MFIDEARQLVEAHGAVRQPLLEAWQETRLRFLAGRLDAPAMLRAQSALRGADADPVLLDQVQEALLSPLEDPGLEARLLALFQELAEGQGDKALRLRQDELQLGIEERWLRQRPLVFGKALPRRDLRRVLAESRLAEERAPAWEALTAPGPAGAEELLEWLRLEDEAARAGGWSGALERRALRLGLDSGRPERWLDELRARLGPAILAAAESRRGADPEATALRRGALYSAGAPGQDGLPPGGFLRTLARKPPLDLLQEVAELLGLEIGAQLQPWVTEAEQLPELLQGLVSGPEGRWPVVLLDLRADPWGARRALHGLGESLARQATAVSLRERGEEPGPACAQRALQSFTLGRLLADLPGNPECAGRLLEDLEPGWEAWWREQALLELGEELLRVDWLARIPATVREAGGLWLRLRREWLGLPERVEEADLWTVDPGLGLRAGESLPRLAARLLAAGLRARWRDVGPAASPEWGGLLLESLTEPDDPELWEESADRLLEALDPAALAAELTA